MHAVVSLAVSKKEKEFGLVTFPLMKKYASKIGASFVLIEHGRYGFEKFQIYDLLSKYDRILFVSPNVILNYNCPDVFKKVPFSKFGALIESNFASRDKEIKEFQERFFDIGWKKEYVNTGVMVVSSIHKEVFNPLQLNPGINPGFESQSQINFNLQKLGVEIFDLGLKFNHIDFGVGNKFRSYIINYAGVHPHGVRPWLEQIIEDIKLIKSLKKYKVVLGKKWGLKFVSKLSKIRALTYNYEEKFCLKGAYIRNCFVLSLPHIIPSLLLMLLFPLKWFGILMLGVILPDIYMGVGLILTSLFKKNYKFYLYFKNNNPFVHKLVFVLIIFLFISKEYVVGIAGLIHLFLDYLGF